jgi:hypothetical protein
MEAYGENKLRRDAQTCQDFHLHFARGGYGKFTPAELLFLKVMAECSSVGAVRWNSRPAGKACSFAFYLADMRVFVEIDGSHHFEDVRRKPHEKQMKQELEKMRLALEIDPGCVFVRIQDTDVMGPITRRLPRDLTTQHTLDWYSILNGFVLYPAALEACRGKVLFLERAGSSLYSGYKEQCGLPWLSVSTPRELGIQVYKDVSAREWWKGRVFGGPVQRTLKQCFSRAPVSP